MHLNKSKAHDINYLSKIVNITEFRSHSNPEVNKLKCCTVDGFNIITGIDSDPGLYVYFPALSCINHDFLSYANLYRDKNLNRNPEKTGMFESNGRVKAIKLRGEISEGFILPINVLEDYVLTTTNKELENVQEGTEFDCIKDFNKEFWISKKYIVKTQYSRRYPPSKVSKKVKASLDRIRADQFRLHYDTVVLRKYPHVIQPTDLIHISTKAHGTSGISAYVLCHRPLNWKQRVARWLTGEQFDIYDYIYSSRTVIKNKYYNKNVSTGFYNCDVWYYADKAVRPHLQKGQTAYYEIVGFLPNGRYIQKNYDYGCNPPKENEEYTIGKHFRVLIYRITSTNVDGYVHEYSTQEVKQWCEQSGLECVEELYYGRACDLYPDLDLQTHWNADFIDKLANDKNFHMEELSPDCANKVPHEGIVIKIENGKSAAFKLKCFKFLNKEQELLDKGESNIEDEA